MRVIGTAGHVDHGKSTLIAALTGTHPDRLKEEQEREMTIDLGFGWLTLPNGEELGIVDVPGHRDFIENMLAGVGGIDAALLIVAADEGVMPQTREHIAILDLLQIQNGLIVITKVDLVDDKDWLTLIEGDIRAALAGTTLAAASAIQVSAKTGFGLDKLIASLGDILQKAAPRLDLARPRLPIDRVFSIAGFGTVVTGTLTDGHLDLGDEVILLPSEKTGRVRGLQTHKKKEDQARPGARTAVNITGVSVEEIARGEVLVTPNHYQPTRRIDAFFRLLPDVSNPLKHASEVKLFIGTSETIATARLLNSDLIHPGDKGWIQLELRDPIVAVRGDRYILRRPSPAETLGGGKIVDAQPKDRHKRMDADVIKRLASLLDGSPADVLLQASLAAGAAPLRDVIARSRLEKDSSENALTELLASQTLLALEEPTPTTISDGLVIAAPQWLALKAQVENTLTAYHHQYPLRGGMPREELKSKLKLASRVFNLIMKKLAAENVLTEGGAWVARVGHTIKFNATQEANIKRLMDEFAKASYSPPSVKEAQAIVGEEVFAALIDLGALTQVSAEVVFRKSDYDAMVEKTKSHLQKNGQITVAEFRDLFNTSRKYALGFLEYLDAIGVTMRDGDYRKLKR